MGVRDAIRLRNLSTNDQAHIWQTAKRGRNTARALRARLIHALQGAFDKLEDDGTPLEELLATAILEDPFGGLALASKFIPKEAEVTVQTTMELHLAAIRQVVQEQVTKPIHQLTEKELLGD